MAREKFVEWRPSPESAAMVDKVNAILDEYQAQGFRLSLRQVYYQLVARDIIPNNFRSYKNLGNVISQARLAGLVDWGMIEDRGRDLSIPPHWTDPGNIIYNAALGYRIDKWRDQPMHVEVMVEKDALSGVLEPVCSDLDIGLTANKGYSSSSALYEAGKRMARAAKRGKSIYVLYFGDHDPSGIDMTRDVRERLEQFSRLKLIVDRVALNMDQVERYQPPENPAKLTDSRAAGYIAEFGESSWELDALRPEVLASLVRETVQDVMDMDLWQAAVAREQAEKAALMKLSENYDDVVGYLDGIN